MLIYPTSRFDVLGNLRLSQIPDPVVIVPPALEPVTIEEMKRHLRIDEDQTEEDEDIADLITSARQFVEETTGLALIDQTLEIRLDGYPANNVIKLRGPILSLVSFQYTDSDSVLQDVDSDVYLLEQLIGNRAPRIVQGYGTTWPTTLGVSDSLRVRWRAGFADLTGSPTQGVEEVPAPLRNAVKLHVEAHFDRDEKMMKALLDAAQSLCRPYKVSFGVA